MPERRKERYLIVDAAGKPLEDDVVEAFRCDPEIEVVDLLGPAGRPDTIVAVMPDVRARKLKEESRGSLIVERDAEVHPGGP